MSNVAISVHIFRNHFRGGGQGDDYLDYAWRGVLNLEKFDYVICAFSLITPQVLKSDKFDNFKLASQTVGVIIGS